MNRVRLFSITLLCFLIPTKGFSIDKSFAREIDVFGAKLSPEEFRLENSKYIKKLSNQLVNPCENFEEYACGPMRNETIEMIKHADLKYTESVLSLSEALIKDLDGNENYEPVTALDKYRIYYSSCLHQNKQKGTYSYFGEILKILDRYGGVPFWNKNWSSDKFDWVKFSAFTMSLNIPTILEVNHYLNDEQTYEYRIGKAPTYLRYQYSFQQDEEFLVKNLKLMGIESEAAVKTAKEIISFKFALVDIESGQGETMTLEEFIKKYPEVNWKSYFSTVFEKNEADLDLSEVIKFENDVIRQVVELISNTKPERIANYMGWQILEVAITSVEGPYINKFENLLSPEHSYLIGYLRNSNRKYTECFKEVNGAFDPLLTSLFYNEYYDKSSEEEAIKLAYEIKSSLQNLLGRDNWIANSTYFEHLNSMKIEIDRPKILSTTELNELYVDLKITPRKYVENWFSLRKFEPNLRDKYELSWMRPLEGLTRSEHTIKLPVFYLMLPLFHNYLPEGLKFGLLGVGVALELLENNPNYRKEDFNSKTKSQELWECYEKEFNIVNSDSDIGIKYFIAFQSSVEAYNSRMNNLKKSGDKKLTEYDLSENQLFFLNARLPICILKDKDKEIRSKMLANMDEFADTFFCPVGSPMNPTKKCKFLNFK